MREQQLRRAAKDVQYEWDMLIYAARYTSVKGAPQKSLYMAIESFLVHYRNLRAFLCPSIQNTVKDDVFASHFLGGGDTPKDVGNSDVLSEDKDRIDKRLAHLSYQRASLGPEWDIVDMEEKICRQMNVFLSQLCSERRAWFKSAAETASDEEQNPSH